jgi:hypothetical protein
LKEKREMVERMKKIKESGKRRRKKAKGKRRRK